MSAPLLYTKLSVPPLRPDLIDRPQLFERLDAGLRLGHQLTLISAMAGSGKTTLVAAWLQRIDRPAGWLALDRDDNDPVRFARQLIAALQRVDSGLGQAAQSLLEAQHLPALDALIGSLINDIAATAAAFVLVIDDFHVIQTPSIQSMIACLLDHQPPQLHLVLLTREDPPLPLARLRARGQMTELRSADLRFTTAEIARFLRHTHSLALDAELVAALEARTEGWVAGVQLAALALRDRDDLAVYLQTFSGSHRYVIDYLAADVLDRLPGDLRSFLQQTAILDRLTAPLCDAVTGRADSAACLQQLEHANLFIIPLDEHREWYRYHPLFAEFLRSALGTDEYPELHSRAAQWYRAHGLLEPAVDHALASNDQQLAADLIAQAAGLAIEKGQPAAVLSWLNALPDEQVCTNVDLAIYKGWTLWLMGQADAAASYARSAATCLETAIGLAAPEEERRVCLDQGPSVMELLPDVRSIAPIFADSLLQGFQQRDSQAEHAQPIAQQDHAEAARTAPAALIEPLSQRECEILRLIATGMPNEAVAHALVIAPGTVKKHLDNIYGKLGVHNRTGAVARARQLDFL